MNYRYRLGHRVTTCPACHRNTFKPYVDTLRSAEIAPSECGRCNREVKCGYHLSPAQYLERSGIRRRSPHPGMPRRRPARFTEGIPALVPPRRKVPDFLPVTLMPRTMCRYDINPLVRFLSTRFQPEHVIAACHACGVGTAAKWGGATVFWYMDHYVNTRSGKIMGYDPCTGRRRKNPAQVGWVHALDSFATPDFTFQACFFGAHRLAELKHQHDIILLVESEKTVLIIESALHQFRIEGLLPLATGGCGSLKLQAEELTANPYYRWRPLRFSRILLLPDADMVQKWTSTDLTPLFSRVRVAHPLTELGLTGSQDIGDRLVEDPAFIRRVAQLATDTLGI